MVRLMFIPFRLLGGVLAGVVATRLFERLWRLFGTDQVPDPEDRETSMRSLVPALLLQGAVFGAVRGLFDHGSRVAFRRLTGRWPGEEPAPERQA